MGACGGRDYHTDNEAENIFIESIQAFSPLRSHTLKDFLTDFKKKRTETTKEEGDKIEEDHEYNSNDYRKFILAHFKNNSPYKIFCKELPPPFEDGVFDVPLKEKPEYNLLLWGLPYLKDKNKFGLLREILVHGDMGLSYGELETFVEHYLEASLVETTKRMNAKLQDLKDGSLKNDKIIDSKVKKDGEEAASFYEGQEYRDIMKKEIMDGVKSVVPEKLKKELSPEDLKHYILNPKLLKEIKGLDFLFDPLELRNYVWFRFKAPPVNLNQENKKN